MDLDKIFKGYQRALNYRRISQTLVAIGIAASLYEKINHRIWPLMVAAAFIAAAVVINIIYWKCPVCGSRLPIRESPGRFECCPHCGTRLKA